MQSGISGFRSLHEGHSDQVQANDRSTTSRKLNVVDAMAIIMATVKSLERNDDKKAMDKEIQAGIVFIKKLGGNPDAEFSHKHCVRQLPTRIDDNPNT